MRRWRAMPDGFAAMPCHAAPLFAAFVDAFMLDAMPVVFASHAMPRVYDGAVMP